jgi:ATP-dependent DNA helicase RecQ
MYYDKTGFLKEDELRLLYVGVTRAKQSLIIHTKHNIFSSYSEIDVIEDSNIYHEPQRLLFQLSHRDVQLGYFKYTQKGIFDMYAGAKLEILEDIVYSQSHQKVLKFSSSYQENIEKLITSGYVISEISVNQIVYWFDKEKQEGFNIVLPEIVFEK